MTPSPSAAKSDTMQGTTQLGMFAKYWQPGSVKTRLAATIGNDHAARVHQANISVLLRRFGDFADHRVLAIAPDERRPEFDQLVARVAEGAWQTASQSKGDLGTRMHDYFDNGFATGHTRILLIGSDSPTIPTATLEAAIQALDSHDVVLGPAEDGGYVLVGARTKTPQIFDGIEWSSERVWEQTLQRLEQQGLSYHSLTPCYDVDHFEDLERLKLELRSEAFQGDVWKELRALVEQFVARGSA